MVYMPYLSYTFLIFRLSITRLYLKLIWQPSMLQMNIARKLYWLVPDLYHNQGMCSIVAILLFHSKKSMFMIPTLIREYPFNFKRVFFRSQNIFLLCGAAEIVFATSCRDGSFVWGGGTVHATIPSNQRNLLANYKSL